MKILPVITALIALVYIGCKDKGSSSQQTNDDTTHFFQTAVIFQKDIKDVDSTAYFIYKIEIANGKKDSSVINPTIFKQLAERFLKPDITTPDMKKYYKGNIFEDRTTNGFAVNYTALDKELEVQSIDVLLKEDGATASNVFIRKFFNYSDSTAIEQLTWKPNQRFQIVRSVKHKDNSESTYQTIVVWNDKKQED